MSKTVKEEFRAEGMTCGSCEKIISKQLSSIDGVKDFGIDYATEEGWVRFDPKKTDIDKILDVIESKGYSCKLYEKGQSGPSKKPWMSNLKPAVLTLGLVIIVFGGYQLAEGALGVGFFPSAGQPVSLLLLFILGLFTGIHCVGMCGGFVVSYTARSESGSKSRLPNWMSHVQYGTGKMLSYVAIGALFGLIGSILIFTPTMRAVAAILAGGFLIIYGLRMMNVFPILRKIRMPKNRYLSKLSIGGNGKRGPMKVGLLNGLMIACGPLQALYIFAAGTGSMFAGAAALFAFGLGTLPIMFGFGLFASVVSRSMTTRILKVSGVIVLVLGVIMLNRGLSISGTGYDFTSMATSVTAYGTSPNDEAILLDQDGYQEIRMEVNRYGWTPDRFILKKDVPVRWIIQGKEINGCNNAIQVPKLGLEFDIKPGEQVIEFTPTEAGTIPFSCWMGMIPGVFIVKDDISTDDSLALKEELDDIPLQAGSCGGSCGSPTCGGSTGGGCGCGS